MPELPEVETFRRTLDKTIKGKSIISAHVYPDPIVFAKKTSSFVKKAFLGGKIKKCCRKGKYLWFEMNKNVLPVFHLGMTGSFIISDRLPDKKMRSIKLILEMDDGTIFIFKDPRRFGRVFLLEDPLHQKPLSKLGPDALNDLPSLTKFRAFFEKRKAPIKAVLLDQSVISGLGNWMVDEVLFQSGIAPQRLAQSLTSAELKRLRIKISSVSKWAVKSGADSDKYPKTWLFHHRWGRRAGCVSSGDKIKHSIVGGRSTAWVPAKQK